MAKGKRKGRILIFSHSSFLGGAERSMLGLVDFLLDRKFSVLVVLPGKGGLEKELTQRSVPYFIVNYSWWASYEKIKPEEYLLSINNIVSFLPQFDSFKPDCIITNSAVIPWGMVTAQLLNTPHIWCIREFVQKDHELIPQISFPELARLIYHGSEKIWFISEAVKKEFEKYIPNDKSMVIFSQVVISKSLVRAKVKSPYKYPDSFRLILPSDISPSKGQDQAIMAAKLLIDKKYNVELLLMGKKKKIYSKYVQGLNRMVGGKYGDRIHILGFVNNPYPIISESSMVLVCSKSEAFSRTMIESGLLGKTFVASDTGANREVDGDNGLFYKYKDIADLAQKIEYMIKNPRIYRKMSSGHKIQMQKKFQKNPIFTSIIPDQLRKIKKESTFVNTFSLYRKILEENHRGNYYQTVESISGELRVIKSSKTYKMWQRYAKIRDNILGFLNISKING